MAAASMHHRCFRVMFFICDLSEYQILLSVKDFSRAEKGEIQKGGWVRFRGQSERLIREMLNRQNV